MAHNDNSSSILDAIKEHTTNIEQSVNENKVNKILKEALREAGISEKNVRECAITLNREDNYPHDKVIRVIDQEYIAATRKQPVTYWSDKNNSYAQFLTPGLKEDFIKWATDNQPELAKRIPRPTDQGHHITRKEIRLVIPSVPERIEPCAVEDVIKCVAENPATVGPIRAGKPYGGVRRIRSLMTTVTQDGFKLIFRGFNGVIPANDGKMTTRLYPKIACKPWACRECFYIGPAHNCEGKACAQCGRHGHDQKSCKSKTRYCSNCKRQGHRAKDASCPIYIREVIKELKRMDIPLDYLQEEAKRFTLIKALQYK